jgi:hypothetical protein
MKDFLKGIVRLFSPVPSVRDCNFVLFLFAIEPVVYVAFANVGEQSLAVSFPLFSLWMMKCGCWAILGRNNGQRESQMPFTSHLKNFNVFGTSLI